MRTGDWVAQLERGELEDENWRLQVMDYLISVTDLKVFGCSIDFLQTATQACSEDPNLGQATASTAYTIVFSVKTRKRARPFCECRS